MKKTMQMGLTRGLLLAMALGLMLNLGGCSAFRRKPPVTAPTPTTEVTPPSPLGDGQPVAPEGDLQRPVITSEPVDFPDQSGVADIRFDYNRADLRRDQLAILDRNLEYFRAHPEDKIMIEGHTDERGTTEYNLSLGQRRASAVQEYLLRNGIPADRLATISRGEEQPLDPGNNESAWARNRRAHFLRFR